MDNGKSSGTVADKFKAEYPQLHDELYKVANEQITLIMQKTLDYGVSNISMGTDLSQKEDREIAMKGLWFRKNDKLQRLKTLVLLNKDSQTKDESVEDTYMDLINYGIISRLVKKGLWRK